MTPSTSRLINFKVDKAVTESGASKRACDNHNIGDVAHVNVGSLREFPEPTYISQSYRPAGAFNRFQVGLPDSSFSGEKIRPGNDSKSAARLAFGATAVSHLAPVTPRYMCWRCVVRPDPVTPLARTLGDGTWVPAVCSGRITHRPVGGPSAAQAATLRGQAHTPVLMRSPRPGSLPARSGRRTPGIRREPRA